MKTISLLSLVVLSNLSLQVQKITFQIDRTGSGRSNPGKPALITASRAGVIYDISIDINPAIKNQFNYIDTIINPTPTSDTTTGKVVISNGKDGLEFSPFSAQNMGALIQPINRITNKGVSTAFYLADSSDWSFYTNSQQRLLINGNGKIIANSPLVINNKDGNNPALSVNGNAWFDSSLILQDLANSSTFISLNLKVKSLVNDADDGISAYTTTPTAWANGNSIPVFRLRHPNVVAPDAPYANRSIQKDFMILPYQYGTAIEYNGVVECWVGEWSIHRGLAYLDTEGKGNGWGGVLWVGDDNDDGGVRATARDNSLTGGNVKYGEISVERFGGAPLGDLRLRLPSPENEFHFVYGERGSTNIMAKISGNGLVIPKVPAVTAIINPEKAQLAYDSTDDQFKGFDGTGWKTLSVSGIFTGSSTQSSNGSWRVYTIAHGQTALPSYFNVVATSTGAANVSYVTADSSSIFVHYTTAPPAGSGNLSWNWQVKK